MALSVIIPTYNRNDLLIKCLDLLAPSVQTIGGGYEVIVTDDSKDNAAKNLISEQYTWAKWVEGPHKGPASNRNNGAKQASGDWLVFIDDDVLPDKNLLQTYQDTIAQNPDEPAFEGAILPDDWELMKKDMSECPINTEGNCFWSANICVKATLFKQINGFNENYLIAAQEDQQMRLDIEQLIKKDIFFVKDCIVIHPVRFTTVNKQLKKIPIASKNFTLYAYKNQDKLHYDSLYRFTLKQYNFHLRNTLRLMASGKLKSSIVSWAWLLYGVPLNIYNLSKLNSGK